MVTLHYMSFSRRFYPKRLPISGSLIKVLLVLDKEVSSRFLRPLVSNKNRHFNTYFETNQIVYRILSLPFLYNAFNT